MHARIGGYGAVALEPTHVIGVDLGGTKILAGVIDRESRIGRRIERPTPTSSTGDLISALESTVEELLDPESIAALGFGIPGTIEQTRGRVVIAPNIPLVEFDFRDWMHQRFGLPVGIDNDANAAAFAEWAIGAGRGTRHMVMLTVGTGIGGGLILDGKPYRGAVGAAAELGHTVIQHDGPTCQGVCMGRGHLESLASGTAATKAARELLGQDATAQDLIDQTRAGNAEAASALTEIGQRLGSGIGSLVNIFNPEMVVVGGGFGIAGGDLLLDPARERVQREALEPARDLARIVPAVLGPDAGLVGAGLVGFEALEA
jgi:glucokinase